MMIIDIVTIVVVLLMLILVFKFLKFIFKYALLGAIVFLVIFFGMGLSSSVIVVDSYVNDGGIELVDGRNNDLIIDIKYLLHSNINIQFYPEFDSSKAIIDEDHYFIVGNEKLTTSLSDDDLDTGVYNLQVRLNDELVHSKKFYVVN